MLWWWVLLLLKAARLLNPMTNTSSKPATPLGLIFLTVFITMVGFGIVIPVLPVYAKSDFKMTPAQLGYLVGVFSLIQLVSSPLFGKLSDRIGRRPVLLVSVLGTAIGFFVLGAAHSGLDAVPCRPDH